MSAKRFILNETSYHGHGAVKEIVTEVKSRNFAKALIVTDADLVRFGVVAKVTDLLDAAGCAYEIYDKVKANPSVAVVEAGVEAFKAAGADYMIAIGGGSPQDTAKAIGIIIDKIKNFLSVVTSNDKMVNILHDDGRNINIKVKIGSEENPNGVPDGCSVVSATYSVNGQKLGTYGVIGPSRMDYQKVVAVLENVGRILEN
ncbi:MAG: iron-containing alcohol dehydrogenase, partial [Akkermansia sp.]|nr:iron-containing alcohol dehydrogenase [Akkermansia sp.]